MKRQILNWRHMVINVEMLDEIKGKCGTIKRITKLRRCGKVTKN